MIIRISFVAGWDLEEMVSLAIFWDKDYELTDAGPPTINGLPENS